MKNKIRVFRAEREITQEELANSVGLSRQTINSIEKGKFIPSVITAWKIAKYFEAPIEEVFKFEDEEIIKKELS